MLANKATAQAAQACSAGLRGKRET